MSEMGILRHYRIPVVRLHNAEGCCKALGIPSARWLMNLDCYGL